MSAQYHHLFQGISFMKTIGFFSLQWTDGRKNQYQEEAQYFVVKRVLDHKESRFTICIPIEHTCLDQHVCLFGPEEKTAEKDFSGFSTNHLADNFEGWAIIDEAFHVCLVAFGLDGTVNVAGRVKDLQI